MTEPANAEPVQLPLGEIVVQVFGRTDVGRTREHNEDAFIVADLTTGNATLQPEVRDHVLGPRGSLFMVADGMGGAAAGEIASSMAVETVLAELQRLWSGAESPSPEAFTAALRSAADAANAAIHRHAAEHPELRGMGTTATVAGLIGDRLYLAQVGDSRAYLVRGGVAQQITKDQSLMQKLIEAGEITAEEAETSERRNIILQALGPEAQIKSDITHQQVRRGDVLVLCSDGLSGQVRAEEIAEVVREESDLVAACKRLIDTANANGGPDNITVIVARFDGAGLADAIADEEVGHRVFPMAGDMTPVDPMPGVRRRSRRSSAERITQPIAAPVAEEPPPAPPARRSPPVLVYAFLALAAVVTVAALALQRFR